MGVNRDEQTNTGRFLTRSQSRIKLCYTRTQCKSQINGAEKQHDHRRETCLTYMCFTKALKLAYGHSVPDRLITVLKAADANRDLVVGFSDGSIQMEYRDSATLGVSKSNEDWTSSNDDISIIGSSFWEITGVHQFDDGVDDPVRDIVTSANETHLIYMFSSGKLGSRRITSDQLIESTPDLRGRSIKFFT